MKKAEDFIIEIFDATRAMSDTEYCEFLEEIASALDDAANVKRTEMSNLLKE
jgi:hypothetical protein